MVFNLFKKPTWEPTMGTYEVTIEITQSSFPTVYRLMKMKKGELLEEASYMESRKIKEEEQPPNHSSWRQSAPDEEPLKERFHEITFDPKRVE